MGIKSTVLTEFRCDHCDTTKTKDQGESFPDVPPISLPFGWRYVYLLKKTISELSLPERHNDITDILLCPKCARAVRIEFGISGGSRGRVQWG